MLTKTYAGTGRICRVTFQLPAEVQARTVTLCGDFNEWDPRCDYMEPVAGGGFRLSLLLLPGRKYQYRYLLDDQRWYIDAKAEGITPGHGGEDAVLFT